MKIIGLLNDTCPNSPVCPRIHATDGPDLIIQGKKLPDAAQRRAELSVPDDEELVSAPRTILDEARLLDPAEFLTAFFAYDAHDLLRVENQRVRGQQRRR